MVSKQKKKKLNDKKILKKLQIKIGNENELKINIKTTIRTK